MSKPITEHQGKKYLHTIRDAVNPERTVQADVYAVLVAFGVTCPARQHAIKKLLCCGNRGKGSTTEDLHGADAALSRAIDLDRTAQKEALEFSVAEKAALSQQEGKARHAILSRHIGGGNAVSGD